MLGWEIKYFILKDQGKLQSLLYEKKEKEKNVQYESISYLSISDIFYYWKKRPQESIQMSSSTASACCWSDNGVNTFRSTQFLGPGVAGSFFTCVTMVSDSAYFDSLNWL